MAASDKTLTDLFPWNSSDEVLKNLRAFTRTLEGLITPLQNDRLEYVTTINQLRDLATRRIQEVLDPAEAAIRDLIQQGFSADKISDSSATGRDLIKVASIAALVKSLGLKAGDVEGVLTAETGLNRPSIKEPQVQGGSFNNPALTGASIKDLADTAMGEEAISAAFVRKLLAGILTKNAVRFDVDQGLNAVQKALATLNVLGFTPIQQGGGFGQGNNRIRAGWDGRNFKVTVDDTDLGIVWTGVNVNFSRNGYAVFPNGVILQWTRVGAGTHEDARYLWPMTFPNTAIMGVPWFEGNTGPDIVVVTQTDQLTARDFALRRRLVKNGGYVGEDPNALPETCVIGLGF